MEEVGQSVRKHFRASEARVEQRDVRESLLAIVRFDGEEGHWLRNIVATGSRRNGLWPAEIQ